MDSASKSISEALFQAIKAEDRKHDEHAASSTDQGCLESRWR